MTTMTMMTTNNNDDNNKGSGSNSVHSILWTSVP